MTTLVLKLPPAMARRLAKAADIIGAVSNEAAALDGLGLFLDSVLGRVRGRKPRVGVMLRKGRRR